AGELVALAGDRGAGVRGRGRGAAAPGRTGGARGALGRYQPDALARAKPSLACASGWCCQRFENWKLLRAPLRPYFLRSFMRTSVTLSGPTTALRSLSSVKKSSSVRPLILMTPVPSVRKMRATAVLRRPVPR